VCGHYFQNDTFCGRILCDRIFMLPGLVAMNVASVLPRSINCTEMQLTLSVKSHSTALGSDIFVMCENAHMNLVRQLC